MQFVVTGPQENIMEQPLVMDARDSLEEVFGKSTPTAAGSRDAALWTKTRGTSAGSAGSGSASRLG